MIPAYQIGLVFLLITVGAGTGIGILTFGWRGKCDCGVGAEHGLNAHDKEGRHA